jgi:TetR/AcrR family transcriptional regulator, transcriptional repressor for nem operon
MARPRGFDPDQVLEHATRVFWARGFEHTSLDDLCAATGLNRSSLYGAFGDKRAIYLQSLERYEAGSLARIRKAFDGKPVREGLRDFLGGLVEAIVAGPGRRGCFIGNCAAEMARLDRTAAARVKKSLQRIEQTFCAAFERGGIADAGARARFITAGVQGLRLYGKANPERKALEEVAATLLQCLDHP